MKPSDFRKEFPWDSVFKKAEYEQIALNIMTILKRTKDEFRDLSWKEYKEERLKDVEFVSENEKEIFNNVIQYCTTEEKARKFSLKWNLIKN